MDGSMEGYNLSPIIDGFCHQKKGEEVLDGQKL